MASFSYTAVDSSGRSVSGDLNAASRGEAFRQLQGRHLKPIEVNRSSEATATDGVPATSGAPPRLKQSQVIFFTEELADLLDAGLQLQQAFGVIHDRQQNPKLKQVCATLRTELGEGRSFSAALQVASPSFDDLYVNLVAAGEASGSLSKILERLARSLTVMHDLQVRFRQAMVYPAFMIGACVMLVVVFTTVLVPQLSGLLAKSGQDLPAVTRVLMSVSGFLAAYWWAIVLGLIACFILFRVVVAYPAGRLLWDRWKLHIPLIGAVVETRFYAGFCQSLGNLVANGVPLLVALKLTTRATGNSFFRACLDSVGQGVSDGAPLSGALRKERHMSELFADMIAVGEQTGNLSVALEKSARRYDKELDKRIQRLTSLISPVIIIFLAIVVSVVAYSIVTSIFSAISGVRSRS